MMENPIGKGYVHIYTGDGKGKTTAALGLCLRAIGHGYKCKIIQFLKGNINYGELKAAKLLEPDLTIVQYGRESFVDPKNPHPEDIRLAKEGFKAAKETLLSKKYQIVVLDELNVAIHFGLIPVEDALELIKMKPEGVELIITGRYAPPELVKEADLVTEMLAIKHYYNTQNVLARKGIEL